MALPSILISRRHHVRRQSQFRVLDRDRINLDQDYEVRDGSKSLGVSEDELRSAVRAVGNTASKVRDYFWQRKRRLRGRP